MSRTIKSRQFGFGLCILQSHAEVLVFITNIFLSHSLLPITCLTGHQEEQQQITALFPNIKFWNLKTDASGNLRKRQIKHAAKMWMLDTVRLQQILTRKHLKNISGNKKKKNVLLLCLGHRRMAWLLCDSAQAISPH